MTLIRGTDQKYIRSIPLVGCLPIMLLVFPYLVQGDTKFSGISMTVTILKLFATQDTKRFQIALLISICVLPIILLILSIITFFKPNKLVIRLAIIAFVSYTIITIILAFGFKKFFDGSGLLQDAFMMKDLTITYWLAIIIGFNGMIITMKSLRITPAYILLVIMSVIWIFPVFYIALNSFRLEGTYYVGYLFPKKFGFDNYINILTDMTRFTYLNWFKNSMIVATFSCIGSTLVVISTAYTMSRIKFRGRKAIMKFLMILGMFPSVMTMIAVYYVIKGLGLAQSLSALIIVSAGTAALGYLIAKGFFDTVPKSLDEAAYIDGATKIQVFFKIMLPIAKPILVYTVLTSFLGPWNDYIFATVILGDKSSKYTMPMGLFSMISRDNIDRYFTQFAAGAVMVSVPISVLFLSLQKYYVEGLSGSIKG